MGSVPICFDGGDFGVVVVVVVIGCTFEFCGDRITEENTEYSVLDGVGLYTGNLRISDC
jgi:hypothetical protein